MLSVKIDESCRHSTEPRLGREQDVGDENLLALGLDLSGLYLYEYKSDMEGHNDNDVGEGIFPAIVREEVERSSTC